MRMMFDFEWGICRMAARLLDQKSAEIWMMLYCFIHPSKAAAGWQSIFPSWFPLLLTVGQDYCVLQATHLHLQNLLLFQFYQTCLPKKYQPCTMCMFHHFGLLRYAIQQRTLPYKVEECLAVVLGTSGISLEGLLNNHGELLSSCLSCCRIFLLSVNIKSAGNLY